MRENRSSGSEGGVALIPPSLPLSKATGQGLAVAQMRRGLMVWRRRDVGFGEPPKPTGQRLVLPMPGLGRRKLANTTHFEGRMLGRTEPGLPGVAVWR